MIRLASANAASGRDVRTGVHDFASWARAARGLEADVLGVQEVDHRLPRSGDEDQTGTLAGVLASGHGPVHARFAATVSGTPGDPATSGPGDAAEEGGPSYGVAAVSRHPVEEWRELRLAGSRMRLPVPLPPGAPQRLLWVGDEPRAALAAVVRTPGGARLTVVTTHLSFSPTRAVAQLREVVVWSRDLPQPVVLLGDLNLPGAVPARVTGWTDAVRGATFPSVLPRLQLDHVLLGPGAPAVVSSHVRPVGASDHLALVVDLDLD